ncbi:MAG: MerR family transcriptional regulator [Deltaproteobacteria bacterium]|nr:MAG: MerR family transcriptional regulator [Deltaproteobacteria bacterium]RLB02973.1 MAG: MerR family transcriptional regulator [Deltaproteobacteria bacterium]
MKRDHGEKLYYRIGEVSRIVGVKPHVIRYWEQEFKLKPRRGAGSQRRYTKEDMERLLTIKRLLYEEGFTIAGAKRRLREMAREGGYRKLMQELIDELKEIRDILD